MRYVLTKFHSDTQTTLLNIIDDLRNKIDYKNITLLRQKKLDPKEILHFIFG